MRNLPGYIRAEKDRNIRKVVRKALTTGASRYLTICEQLRFIYDTVRQIPEIYQISLTLHKDSLLDFHLHLDYFSL